MKDPAGKAEASFNAYRAAKPNDPATAGEPERLGVMRPVFVAETQAAADAVMRPAINLMMERGVRASTNLEAARLRCADLRGARLREAVLRGADLSEADLTEADLRNCELDGANLPRRRGAVKA